MKTYTTAEWQKEATKRFGEESRHWKFQCPSCKHVQSPQDFVDAGQSVKEASNKVYQECIGRYNKEMGCTWVSYGFLRTVGEGVIINVGNDKVEIFDFAPKETVH